MKLEVNSRIFRSGRIAIFMVAAVAMAVVVRGAKADDSPEPVSSGVESRVDAGTAGLVANPSNEIPIPRRQSELTRRSESRTNDAAGIQLPKSSVFETFWPMLAVLGLIVICVAAIRKWLPQATRISGGSVINILARQYLSGKQSLALVKVGKRVVLVGVTPEAMSTLTEISDPEEIASLAASLQRGKVDSFSSALSRESLEAMDASDDADEVVESSPRQRPRGMGETETRIQELVGRIRAMSTGSTAPASGLRRRK